MKNCKLHYYNPNDRDEWLKLRNHFTGINTVDRFAVGASEVATILGYNKYESDFEFYYRAIGLSPKKNSNNAFTYQGTVLEEFNYKHYFRHFNPDEWNVWGDSEHQQNFFDNAASTNAKIFRTAKRCNAVVANPKYPYLFINYDYILNKSKWNPVGPLELKSQQGAAMDTWEGGINPAYIFQIQAQMLVGGYKYGELFVLRNVHYPVSFPFERNKNIQEQIIEGTRDWNKRICNVKAILHSDASQDEKDMVVMENEPELNGSEALNNFLKEIHKPENELEVDASSDFTKNVLSYLRYKRIEKRVDKAILLPENAIRKYLEDIKATKANIFDEYGSKLGHVSYKSKLSISPKILQTYEERL